MIERFDKYWQPIPEAGCWLWTGALQNGRYGSFAVKRKATPAHRVSWMLRRGEIPAGLHVLHRCDVQQCVNPSHLFLGSHQENMADMARKKRARSVSGDKHWTKTGRKTGFHGENNPWFGKDRRGENNPVAKLTEKQVKEIRLAKQAGKSDIEVSKLYGIRPGAVWSINTRKTWRHV